MALKKVPMYIKNVSKSIKYSGMDYLNNVMPETMDFVSTNSEVLKAVTNDLRNYKTIYKQAKTWWNASSVKGTLSEGVSNALKDLSTGNFYNKDRESNQMFKDSGWEDVLGGFEEDINSAINDFNSANTLNANTSKSIAQNTEATVGVMSTVGKIVSETTANSAEYIVKSNNDIANKNMVNTYKLMGNVTTLLSDISTNIRSINEYTNKIGDYFNNTSKVNAELNNKLDQLLALQKEVAEMERNKYKEYDENKNNNYVEPLDNTNFTRGAFDIKAYVETVMKRAKSQYENSTIGSMQGMMQGVDPLKLIASNPLKFISDAGFNKLVSKELRNSMKTLDETVNGFFNSAILKGSTFLRKKADETGSDIFNTLADVFGIKRSDPGKMRTDMYVKESIPWNGMADRALTEVLPTYARKILSAITGQEEMIYDYKSGKFNKITDVKKALEQAEDYSYNGVSGMENEIAKTIKEAFTMSNSLQETFDKDLKDFFKTLVDKQVFYNPNKITYNDLNNMGLYFRNGKDSFDLINAAFQSMDRQKWNKFNTNVINAGETRRSEIDNLNRTGAQLGYTGVRNGFGISTDENGKNLLAQGFGLNQVDKYKKSVFDYMRDIRRILLEGIRVFPVNGIVSDSIQLEGGSIENRINHYRDNESEHHTTNIRVSDYNESDEDLRRRAERSNGTVLESLNNLGLSNRGMADYMKRIRNERNGQQEQQNQQPEQNDIVSRSRSVIGNIYDTGRELASAPGKILKNIIDSVNDNLLFFLYGSRSGEDRESIFDSIMKRVNDITEKISNTVNDHVINPLNNVLFNEDNGIITKFNNKISGIMEKVSNKLFNNNDGVFTNLKNKATELFYGNENHHGIGYYIKGAAQDTFNGFMNVASGKEYTSVLTGKKHEARQETMLSIFKDGFESIKDAGRKMFAKLSNSASGLSLKETISNRINSMTARVSNTLFGTTEESMKPGEFFSRHISPRLPRSMMGAMAGLGLSIFTPLGLVGGIAVGGATGFLSYFDKFKTVLFGEEGSEKRMKADNFFSSINNALPKMGVGTISGAALSLFTPLGLVGGTMLGGVMGYLSTSDKFKEFIFGNGVDKKGIIKREWYDKFKEKMPGGAIGAGMGAIGSLFLPGGPVGGAIMGLTLGIAGQSNMIKTYLFGNENPETGKREGGLFGKFKIFMQTEVIMPLKTFAKEVGSKGMYFIRKDLINPILDSLAPIKKEMSLIKDKVFEKIGEIKDSIVNKAEELILRPINKAVTINIIDPMKNFFKKIFGGIGNALKNILKAPSSMINGYAMNLMEKHKKMGVADYLDDWQKKKNERDMKTNKKYQESQQEIMFEKYRNDMASKLARKGKYDINDPNTRRAMDWMNMNGYKYTENISNKMDENTSILDRLKNLFTEFKSRWDIRNNFKPSGNNNTNDSREERQRQRILNNQNRNNNKNNNDYEPIIMPGDISGSNQPNFVLVNNPSNNNRNNRRASQPNFIMMDNNQPQNTNYNTNNNNDSGNTFSDPFKDLNSIKKDTSTIAESVDGQVNGVGYHTELISNILVDLFGLPSILPSGGKKFSHKIKGLFDILKGPKQFLGKITNMITAPFKSAFNLIKGIPAQVAKTTGSIIKITAGAIKSVAGSVLGIIPQILEGINIIGKTVGNVMISAFKTLPSIVKTLGVAVQETTKVLGRGLVEGVKVLGTGLKEAAKFTGEFAVGLAKTAKTVIPAFAEGLIETTKIIGKGVLGAIKGTFNLGKKMVSGIAGKRKNRNMVEQVMNIERINKIGVIESVKMVEKIGDVRLFESLGQMTTAIYSLRTGTDDMPVSIGSISNNDERNENHEQRSKSKDKQVRGKVVSITDRINRQKSKEKRERNNNINREDSVNMPALGSVVDGNTLSDTGNKQVDLFKNKEIGQVVGKNTKIRNALSMAADKANVATGKLLARVFKKGGILSTIGTLAMALMPKVLSFFTGLKSKVLSLGKRLIDYFLNKFHINIPTPNFGGVTRGAVTGGAVTAGSATAAGATTGRTALVSGEKAGTRLLLNSGSRSLADSAIKSGTKNGMRLLGNTITRGAETGTERLLLNGAVESAETGTERLLLNGTVESAERGVFNTAEKYGAENVIKGVSYTVMDEGGEQIAKSGFKNTITRMGQKAAGAVVGDSSIIKKVLNSSAIKKLAGSKISTVLGKLATFITSRMKNAGKAVFGKIAAKWAAIIGTGAASGGIIPALWYGGTILYGVTETKKIFQLSESDKPSALMRTIAGFSSFLSDALTFGLLPTSVIAQFLGSHLLGEEEVQHIRSSQEQLKNEYNEYLADTGDTDMSFDEYNNKVNGSIFTKAGTGIKNIAKKYTAFGAFDDRRIRENMGLDKDDEITTGARLKQGFGSTVQGLSLGLISDKSAINALDWGAEKGKQIGQFVKNKTVFSAFNDDAIRNTFGLDENVDIELKDRFSQGFGTFISNITGGALDQTKVSKAAQGVLITAEEKWNKLGEDVKNFVMNDTAASAFNDDAVRNTFGLDEGVEIEKKDRFSQGFGAFISNITGGTLDKTKVAQATQGTLIKAEGLWGKLQNKVGEYADKVEEMGHKLNTNLGSMLGFVDEDGNPLTATEGLGQTWNGIKEKASKAWEGAKGLWSDLGTAFDKFKDYVKDGVVNFDKDLGKMFGFKNDNGEDMSLTEKVKQKITDVTNSFTNPFVNKSNEYNAKRNASAKGGSGFDEGGMGVPYYGQNQGPWANKDFGYNKTIGEAGCGPTAAAMMISSVTGKKITPEQTAKDALNGGYRLKGNGTKWDYLNSAGNKYGVTTTQTNSMDSVKSALRNNHPVVLNGKGPNGPFTPGGHYVTATGMTKDGKIMINDPLSKSRSGAYDPKVLEGSTRKAWISNQQAKGGSGKEGTLTKGELVVNSARKLINRPYRYGF